MKNIISIKTILTTNVAIEVKNFSFEEVAKGISQLLQVKQKDVFQLVANVNGGIYGSLEHTSYGYNALPESPIKDERTSKTFTVEYLQLTETKTN